MGKVAKLAMTIGVCATVVSILLMTLPIAFLGLAASGSTLSNPADAGRVGGVFLAYILADAAILFLLMIRPAQRLLWLVGGALASLPIAVFLIMTYLNGGF